MALVDDYISAVLADSPEAFWPMQEASGNLADATGNGHTAVDAGLGGTLTYRTDGPCRQMYAIEFDGDSGFDVADDDAWSGPSLSIECICHKNALARATSHDFLARKQHADRYSEWSLIGQTSDYWGGRIANTDDTAWCDAWGPPDLDPCKWVHLAFTYDPTVDSRGTGTAYVNGTAIVTSVAGDRSNDRQSNGDGVLGIGYAPGWSSIGWLGRIAMMAFWDRTLTAGEVADHYAAMPHGCGIGCPRRGGWSVGMLRSG